MKQSTKWLCILAITALIFSIKAKAQPFIGMGLGNTITATGGVLVDQFQLSVNYSHPYSSTIKPAVTSLELGRQIFIGERGSLILSIGAANCSYSIVENNEKVSKVKELKPIYSVELGIDKGMGRVSVYGKWCGGVQVGVSIKGFFN